jgi:hypothetical protein
VGVFGLDEILAELYAEKRKPNDETATLIIKRLETKKNFIPPSENVRRDYAYVLLKEYRKYINEKQESKARSS